jgi:hypothetical protein
MNTIKLDLDVIQGNDWVEYEGITFSNCAFIKLIIDDIDLVKLTDYEKGVVVWDEIKKTRFESGDFLILTCLCGIADDGGFQLITVSRNENTVNWTFNDGSKSKWEFDKNEYDAELIRLENEISKLSVLLEPKDVLFPE